MRRRVIRIAGRPESLVEELAQPVYGAARRPRRRQSRPRSSPRPVRSSCMSRRAARTARALDAALEAAVDALAAALGRRRRQRGRSIARGRRGRRAAARGNGASPWPSRARRAWCAARLTESRRQLGLGVGGVVAYDNAIKESALGVAPRPALGARRGQRTSRAGDGRRRARAVWRRRRRRRSLASPGPLAARRSKPVGTVVIAIATPEARRSARSCFSATARWCARSRSSPRSTWCAAMPSRLFLALAPDAEARDRLARVAERVRLAAGDAAAALRWVTAGASARHAAFSRHGGRRSARPTHARIRDGRCPFRRIAATFDAIGTFPGAGPPRVCGSR